MSLIDIDRLERMHEMICRKATGTPDEFAEKLNISRSMLMNNLSQLKEKGGPIQYDSLNKTYCYTKSCRFWFGYEVEEEALGKIKGGINIFDNFNQSNHIRLTFCTLALQGFES